MVSKPKTVLATTSNLGVGHVSVKMGFVEPFGNLLGAFERGRFQTPLSVVSKGAQWFPSQKNDFAPRPDAGSVKDSVMPLLRSEERR